MSDTSGVWKIIYQEFLVAATDDSWHLSYTVANNCLCGVLYATRVTNSK